MNGYNRPLTMGKLFVFMRTYHHKIRGWKEWDSCYCDLLIIAILNMNAAYRSRLGHLLGNMHVKFCRNTLIEAFYACPYKAFGPLSQL